RQRTEDLSASLDQQMGMSEVLRVISSSPTDLAPVFDTILTNATRLCEGNFALRWLPAMDSRLDTKNTSNLSPLSGDAGRLPAAFCLKANRFKSSMSWPILNTPGLAHKAKAAFARGLACRYCEKER